jgi:hypothetical protein
LQTPRWRKTDSNSWSHRKRNGCERAPGGAIWVSDLTLTGFWFSCRRPGWPASSSPFQERDRRFESGSLQRRVCKLSVPVCSGSTGPMICTRPVMEGSLQALYPSLKLPARRRFRGPVWSPAHTARRGPHRPRAAPSPITERQRKPDDLEAQEGQRRSRSMRSKTWRTSSGESVAKLAVRPAQSGTSRRSPRSD